MLFATHSNESVPDCNSMIRNVIHSTTIGAFYIFDKPSVVFVVHEGKNIEQVCYRYLAKPNMQHQIQHTVAWYLHSIVELLWDKLSCYP